MLYDSDLLYSPGPGRSYSSGLIILDLRLFPKRWVTPYDFFTM